MMAQYPKIESMGSIGSIILAILQVQGMVCRGFRIRVPGIGFQTPCFATPVWPVRLAAFESRPRSGLTMGHGTREFCLRVQ